jgi:hypothetical protein
MEPRFPRSFTDENMKQAMEVSDRTHSISNFNNTYPFFVEWYKANVSAEPTESPKEEKRFAVFKELTINLHEGFVKRNYAMTVPVYKCIFEQILLTLQRVIKKDLDCIQAYEFLRNSILKFTLDDGWINKHLFNKEDIELIFMVAYDCLLFKIEYYKVVLARKKCLNLVCIEPLELPSPKTNSLANVQLLLPNEIPEFQEFLSRLPQATQSTGNIENHDQDSERGSQLVQTITEGVPFQLKTKEQLRAELAQQERERKIQAILDREMAKLVEEFNAKPLTVAK